MMKSRLTRPLLALLAVAFIAGCATSFQPLPAFQAQPLEANRYHKKAENLIFILDASASMAEPYGGHRKMDIARGVVENFNATMPDTDVAVALHSFGHADSVARKSADTRMSLQPYNRSTLAAGLSDIDQAGGASPMAAAFKQVRQSLGTASGPLAVIVVSDGKEIGGSALKAASELKAAYGDRLCLHTVQVGDAADGRTLMEKIAGTTDCGKALSADALQSGKDMRAYVRDVLFTTKMDSDNDGVTDDEDQCPDTPAGLKVDARGCPLDSDRDGVYDYRDRCPDTPAGTRVDSKGCAIPVATQSAEVTDAGTWIYKDIQFETNRAELRPRSFATLEEITTYLSANTGLDIEIQGHTDSRGARDYNVNLSQRRADAVKAYLVSKGIDAGRMTTRGYGPDRPIAGNASKDGRARNRRVEIKPIR